METYLPLIQSYLPKIETIYSYIPPETFHKMMGVGIFFIGVKLFRRMIPMALFGAYTSCRGVYKKITYSKPYVPLYVTSLEVMEPHVISLWLMNINDVELFDYHDTMMDEIICRGIEKFKIGFDPAHHQKKYEVNLWEIAKLQYDEIYQGQKDFPKKIVIHLSPETLLFTKIPIQYHSDYTIVLSPETVNQITFI